MPQQHRLGGHAHAWGKLISRFALPHVSPYTPLPFLSPLPSICTCPPLAAQIATVQCRCGMLLAFWFLERRESPKTFFDFFVSRYPRAPSMVVYDHACGLCEYALNRMPHWWRFTQFRVDVFHWPNHVACSEAFNFSAFVESDPEQYQWNTNAAEHFNRRLKKFRLQVSFMDSRNAIPFVEAVFRDFFLKLQDKLGGLADD